MIGHQLQLLDELVADHGEQLIGLSEFAELMGLTESRAAQLRAERNRDPDFPPAIQASGRSIVHLLGPLVAWARTSRFADEIATAPVEIWRWRLERSAYALTSGRTGQAGREVVAGIALARAAREYADVFAAGQPSWADVLERAQALPRPGEATIAGLTLDPPAASDGRFMAELLGGQRVTKQAGNALIHDLDGLRTACVANGEVGDYAHHVEGALNVVADSSRSTHRATSALSHLLAVLVDARPGDVVYEPTCGECETLVRVADLARRVHGGEIVAVGGDRDPDSLRIGRARLSLHDVAHRLRHADALGDDVLERPAQRMIVDPGSVHPAQLGQWARHVSRSLATDGRAVLVLSLTTLDRTLLQALPPARIVVLPRGVTAPGAEAAALWVHDRAAEQTIPCDVIDLRQTARLTSPEERLARFLDSIGNHAEGRSSTVDRLAPILDPLLPHTPHVTSVRVEDLHHQFRSLSDGPLQSPDERDVVEDNQRWALQLALELERLVSADAEDREPYLPGAPDRSPTGVLAASTSDEARRIVRRLRSNLDPAATTRRGRPRRSAS